MNIGLQDANIILITGESGQGKSTFCDNLCKEYNTAYRIDTDGLFAPLLTVVNKKFIKVHPTLGKYVDVGDYCRDPLCNVSLVLEQLTKKLENIPNNKIFTLLIEGYFVTKYFYDVKKLLISKGLINITHIDMENRIPKVMIERPIKEENKFEVLFDIIKEQELKNLDPLITYQTFDFTKRKDSNSKEKLKLSKIPNDLTNKKCLDIGCNNGYFCFEMSKRGASYVQGLDVSAQAIKVANRLNGVIFKKPTVEFLNIDIFQYDRLNKFDVIFCASVFHYFKEQQKDFISKCYNLLNNNGLLILEVEEYPVNDFSFIEKRCRSNSNDPLYYPNRLSMIEMVKQFKSCSRNKSTFQSGGFYERYFYQLQK